MEDAALIIVGLMVCIIIIVTVVYALIKSKQFNKRKGCEYATIDSKIQTNNSKETLNFKIDKVQSIKLFDINTGEMVCELNGIREVSAE